MENVICVDSVTPCSTQGGKRAVKILVTMRTGKTQICQPSLSTICEKLQYTGLIGRSDDT